MAIQLLIDYLTGKHALVNNNTTSTSQYEITPDFLTGQMALVFMTAGVATPPPSSYFFPMFFNQLVAQ